jgi:hypothetical protein
MSYATGYVAEHVKNMAFQLAGHAHCFGLKVQESDWPNLAGHYPFAIHAESSGPPRTVGTNGVFVVQNCNGQKTIKKMLSRQLTWAFPSSAHCLHRRSTAVQRWPELCIHLPC